MDLLICDWETYYDRDYTLSKLSMEEYIRSPLFECIMLGLRFPDGSTRVITGTHAEIQYQLDQIDWSTYAVACHNCVTGDHEVRTKNGWVRFDELPDGVEVLQWNPKTEALTWVIPTVVRKPYNGRMLAWNSGFHKGVYTPEHRMYTRTPNTLNKDWVVKTAEQVGAGAPNNNYIPVAGLYKPESTEPMSQLEARILEMARADANVTPHDTFRFRFSKARKIERCEGWLTKAGISYNLTVTSDGVTSINTHIHPLVSKICKLIGYGKDKQYGPWVLELPIEAREAILDELPYWDGYVPDGVGTNIATTIHSAKASDIYWLNELAIFTNRCSKASYNLPNTRGFSRSDGVISHAIIRTKKYAKTQYKPEEINHQGIVYCLNVPDQAFLVRREGVTWVTGNCLFDAAIFTWKFNVKPRLWLDTMGMGRAMFGGKGNSLKALAERYNLEEKGTYVANMMGRRRESLSPEEFEQYAGYCLLDCELTYDLWQLMSQGWYSLDPYDNRGTFPKDELKLIDKIIRMYTEPVLKLDVPKLQEHYDNVVRKKAELIEAAGGIAKEGLMSNNKFAAILESYGVEPPTKISPTTGKTAFAFAKTDAGIKELLAHPNPEVQAIVAARLGVKSTIEETRSLRFIQIGSRGLFPVPLRYGAARTHRLGGTDKINLQNLGARGKEAGKIKQAIEPPDGYVIIDCDSSNIEARGLAWLAEQTDLVEDFKNKIDVYCKMATRIYGFNVTKEDKLQRFCGKTVVLGAGYQTGGLKLQNTLRVADPPMLLTEEECQGIIKTYRATYPKIPALWRQAERAIQCMHDDNTMWLGKEGVLWVDGKKGIRLPNGLYLSYPQLHNKDGKWMYKSDYGFVDLYGGKLVENVCQALARIIVMTQLLLIAKRYRVVLTVHDAVACIARKEEAEEARAYVEVCMRFVPEWAAGWPLDCESGIGSNYGEC